MTALVAKLPLDSDDFVVKNGGFVVLTDLKANYPNDRYVGSLVVR